MTPAGQSRRPATARSRLSGVRVVAALAMAALFALVVALLGGGTTFGVLGIGVAALGIVLLARDWWDERGRGTRAGRSPLGGPRSDPLFVADEFSPDISTDPDGPSSDARAD